MFVAVVLCACLGVPAAYGLEPEGLPLKLEAPEQIELSFVDVRQLPFTTSPEYVEVGISCGMEGMCGQDPCLCGSSDAWGACSCNGLEVARPTYALAAADGSDVGFVRIVDAPGGPWLVSAGPGEADVIVTAELAHYAPAATVTHIRVAPFGPFDALKIAALLVCAALLVAGVVMCVRAAVRGVRAAASRLRRLRRARGFQQDLRS